MGYCKDCKHWRSHLGEFNKAWETCEGVDWTDMTSRIKEDDFALYAEAHDDSGLSAGLRTGPLFGCIKFSPKLTEAANHD